MLHRTFPHRVSAHPRLIWSVFPRLFRLAGFDLQYILWNSDNKEHNKEHTERIRFDAICRRKHQVWSLLPLPRCFSVPMVCKLPLREYPRIFQGLATLKQYILICSFLFAQRVVLIWNSFEKSAVQHG